MSMSATSRCLSFDAKSNRVDPLYNWPVTSVPRKISMSATSSFPSFDAKCNEVLPSYLLAVTPAPCWIGKPATSSCPSRDAPCHGIFQSFSCAIMASPQRDIREGSEEPPRLPQSKGPRRPKSTKQRALRAESCPTRVAILRTSLASYSGCFGLVSINQEQIRAVEVQVLKLYDECKPALSPGEEDTCEVPPMGKRWVSCGATTSTLESRREGDCSRGATAG